MTTLPNASTTSNPNDTFTVLVGYGNQVKLINITQNDDLFSIERKIYERYNFNDEQRGNFQIQWYDNDFKSFIDLDSETWSKYVGNRIHTNSSKHLKLVHKYLSQQPDDVTEQRQIEMNNEQNGAQSPINNSFTVIPKTPAYQTSGVTEDRIGSELERMNQSIHTDWVLNGLGWLLPLLATFAHVGDALWLIFAYDPKSIEQHSYAGLTSTILILFYYLQYDVKINLTHPKLYLFYQFAILSCILAGDILYVYYYIHYIHSLFLMIIFILYGIIDSAFVFTVGYLKWSSRYRVSMGLSIHNLFHLMSRLEVLLIILIPIFTAYDVISTNSIAFFILYEFFSHSYNNSDLIYSGYSRLSFWLLIIFATTTVICENLEFVYDHRAQDEHDQKKEEYFHRIALRFLYASNAMEVLASSSCYALIILQFFSKSDKRKRLAAERNEIQTE